MEACPARLRPATGAADGLRGKRIMPDTATSLDSHAGVMFHSADLFLQKLITKATAKALMLVAIFALKLD